MLIHNLLSEAARPVAEGNKGRESVSERYVDEFVNGCRQGLAAEAELGVSNEL